MELADEPPDFGNTVQFPRIVVVAMNNTDEGSHHGPKPAGIGWKPIQAVARQAWAEIEVFNALPAEFKKDDLIRRVLTFSAGAQKRLRQPCFTCVSTLAALFDFFPIRR